MTITEKILAQHAGRDRVSVGENVWIDVDVLMTHDVCGPPTIGIFKREFGKDAKVWDKEKLVNMPDHYIFTKNHHANRNVEILREFAAEHDLPHYYDVGTDRYIGVCHMGLAEEGFNRPGSGANWNRQSYLYLGCFRSLFDWSRKYRCSTHYGHGKNLGQNSRDHEVHLRRRASAIYHG